MPVRSNPIWDRLKIFLRRRWGHLFGHSGGSWSRLSCWIAVIVACGSATGSFSGSFSGSLGPLVEVAEPWGSPGELGIASVGTEHLLHVKAEVFGKLHRQLQRRNISEILDGADGLAGHAHLLGHRL